MCACGARLAGPLVTSSCGAGARAGAQRVTPCAARPSEGCAGAAQAPWGRHRCVGGGTGVHWGQVHNRTDLLVPNLHQAAALGVELAVNERVRTPGVAVSDAAAQYLATVRSINLFIYYYQSTFLCAACGAQTH